MPPQATSFRAAANRTADSARASSHNSGLATEGMEVLVVDDDNELRELLCDAVRSFGYSCREAVDGAEAWRLHNEIHVDIMIADWSMPSMTGVELCRRVRGEQPSRGYTYFILLTTFSDKTHLIDGMDAGADDYQTKPPEFDELRARLASGSRVVNVYRELAKANARLRRDSEASFHDARTDALTGVPNRLRMQEDLVAAVSLARRYKHRYSVAICDIDEFKLYNDHFGHPMGDAALVRVAQCIAQRLRTGDAVYRYGGEEFLVLLPEQSLTEASCAMARIRTSIEELAIRTMRGSLTLSVGVAELRPELDAELDSWIRRADRALYRAKNEGRNRVVCEDAECVAGSRESTIPPPIVK